MPDNGVRTIDLTQLTTAEDLLGHDGGTLGVVPRETLALLLAASGAVADRLAELDRATSYASVLRPTWTALAALAPEAVGQQAEVSPEDTGSHTDPQSGEPVANAGRYTAFGTGAGQWAWVDGGGLGAKLSITGALQELSGPFAGTARTNIGAASQEDMDAAQAAIATKASEAAMSAAEAAIATKAGQDDLDALTGVVGGKADAAAVQALDVRTGSLEGVVQILDPDFSTFSYAVVDADGTALTIYDLEGQALGDASEDADGFDPDFSEAIWAIVGQNDRVAQILRQDGSMAFPGGMGTDTYRVTDIDGDFSENVFTVVDQEDKVLQRIDRAGNVYFPASDQDGSSKPAPTVRRPRVHETLALDINHHVMNGQSNSVRSGLYLPVSDPDDVAFSGGIFLQTEEIGNTLVGIGTVSAEQCIIWNAVQQMKFLIQGSDDYSADEDYEAGDYVILPSSHGTSGASIANLSKGGSTGSYEDALHGVDEAVRLAAAEGKATAVQSLSWVQGESDRYDTAAEYKTKLQAMLADYRADIAARTGQSHDFIVLIYQPSGNQYSFPTGELVPNTIAQAIFEASEEDPRILIAAPMYQAAHADDLHFASAGGKLIGMQWGKVLYKRVYRGEDWRPVEPRRITKHSPRVITVKFHVPEAPLLFDTTHVVDPGGYGFTVEDDSGVLSIASVDLINSDTVRITTATDIGTNPKLGYAYYGVGGNGGGPITGARGCLRDSDPTVGADGSTNLWNWAETFQKPIPYVKGA